MDVVVSATLIALLASLTPGPDIFLTVLNSLRDGRRAGIWTTLGIVTGVALQLLLGLSGLSLLITSSPQRMEFVQLAGSAWLIYLGVNGLRGLIRRPEAAHGGLPDSGPRLSGAVSMVSYYRDGLVTNLLNPKALLFFLSLFVVVLGPDTPFGLKVVTAVAIVIVQAAAFSLIAVMVDRQGFRRHWPLIQGGAEAILSILLLGLGIWLVLSLR